MTSTLTAARRATSARLSGLEIPDCFAAATAAAEANILARPVSERRAADAADLRRAADKARHLESPAPPAPVCSHCEDVGRAPEDCEPAERDGLCAWHLYQREMGDIR